MLLPDVAWPINYTAEFIRRARLLDLLNNDAKLRAATMVHYGQFNAKSCIDFINDWCVTFDPRNRPPVPRLMPFRLFKRQEEFVECLVECLRDRQPLLVEKARDMGVSWLCCAIAVWLWIFHPGTVIGFGSRKGEYVDNGNDPKSIFTKIRQIIANLPIWMHPPGFSMDKNSAHMRIIAPKSGGAITGEAGDKIGRGGRTTIYFKDESAHYEDPESIEAALGDNTDVQVDVSSVNGTANVFYDRRMAGVIWEPGKIIERSFTRVFIFEWRHHPGKSQEWYDERCANAARTGLLHVFKQEVDRDYAGAVDRIIIHREWVDACVDAHKILGFAAEGRKYAGQDIKDEGKDLHARLFRHGVVMIDAEHWGEGDAGQAAQRTIPKCMEHGIDELYYDSVGVGSGFKVSINYMRDNGQLPKRMIINPWNGGQGVLDPEEHIIPGDDQSPTNEEQWGNLKAQAWFMMRNRCYKTFRAVRHGDKYPFDELISIPSDLPHRHQLQLELSQAVVAPPRAGGKTIVDKKPKGSKSPNLADAAVICYCPLREISILDVL